MLNPDDRWAFETKAPRKYESSSDVAKTTPTNKPKKDFRKFMDDKGDDEEEDKKLVSKKKGSFALNSQISSTEMLKSPLDAFQSTAKKNKKLVPDEGKVEDDVETESSDEKEKAFAFAQEQPDIAGISGKAHYTETPYFQIDTSVGETKVHDTKSLQELITQLVDKMYTMKKDGTTDTVLILKHPPLFQGATLTLTSFDSAKGEFNISFNNLNPMAKELLDMQQAQNSLKKALDEKGYTVHIIVVTTETDTRLSASESSESRKREQGDDSQQQQQKEKDDEEGQG